MKTETQKMLLAFNEAFAKSDITFIEGRVTDDIRWHMIGDRIIDGKEQFLEALQDMAMDEPMKLTVDHIITHGKSAAVNGTMTVPGSGTVVAFCDIYTFNGFKNPKIKEMTSYGIEVK